MSSDSCWERGCASLLSAVEAIPYPCPSLFGAANRYQLVELTAITSKSWIYRAKDLSFAIDGEAPFVAIKVSRQGGLSQEACLGRKVDHEGVVRLLDHGQTAEMLSYVVMEWVEGGDLDASEVPWSEREAARFVTKLARVVQAAHGVFVIHCDLKPSNVLLTRDREPRLADFDLAERLSQASEVRKGTLAYMAPEQYRGLPGGNSVQADVYALGGILHFMVVGAPPHGSDPVEIAASLSAGRVPRCAGMDADLASIAKRALSPELSYRYRSADALAADLERWVAFRPLEWKTNYPHRRGWMWARRHPATAVALSALLASGVIGVAARYEWLRRERVRDSEVAARSEKKAKEHFDAATSGAREMLLSAGRMLTKERRNQMNDEEVLASLTVLQWLELPQREHESAKERSLNEYGIELWSEILARLERRGAPNDSLALLAHINLSRLAVSNGDDQMAARHLAQAEHRCSDQLADNDSTRVAIRVLRAILVDRGAIEQAVPLSQAARTELETEAKQVGIGESLLRQLRTSPVGTKRRP